MDPSTKTLAEGCFGKVYRQKFGDKWAAMKKVPVQVISEKELERECRVYNNARHNNVVKLLGKPWLKDGKWHIPLEFIFGEDLETAIFNVQESKIQLTPSVKATIITGMCEGLTFLHSKDIVHQDLKPDNIMIEHGSHRAVIIDMGLAKFFKNGLSSAANMGNPAYSAPEVFQGSARDLRSDVWAMGKIIAELCHRVRLPTYALNPDKIKETMKDNPYTSVVSRMVLTNPAERAIMSKVIGEIRQIEAKQEAPQGAGAGRPNPGLGVQLGGQGKEGVDVGARRFWDPLSPLSPEARHQETALDIHNRLFQRHEDLFAGNALANRFAPMHLGAPSPGRMVVNRHEAEFKHVVMRNGKVVHYEHTKMKK
ncbi:uncharacterized protein Hap1MRO34_000913 [Clarias gariepinus]